MNWKRIVGLAACLALFASCFMHWAWYPDLQKYFTGFFSEKNHYGRPGVLFSVVAAWGVVCYLAGKKWMFPFNLVLAAVGMAYALKSYFLFTGAYDGYVPAAQPGIYIMLLASVVHLILAMLHLGGKPAAASTQVS